MAVRVIECVACRIWIDRLSDSADPALTERLAARRW